jgi:glutathione S-transferase
VTGSAVAHRPLLVIGNRNYSSWSLRAWLFLRQSGIDFETRRLPLDTPEFQTRIGHYSPSGRVPVLVHGSVRVWDSLAICEYAGETFDAVRVWPESPALRAEARSVVCEMHAGFAALRAELPMNCRARNRRVEPSVPAGADIRRILSICESSLAASGGPWLFGDFTVADATFAPVASRFATYGITTPGRWRDWQHHLFRQPAMDEWLTAAMAEPEVIEADETGGGS